MSAPGCPVCSAPAHVRRDVDAALASDGFRSPRRISGMFRTLSRAQIRRHRDGCLLASPRVVAALRRGDLTGEALAGLMRDRGLAEPDVEAAREALTRAAGVAA